VDLFTHVAGSLVDEDHQIVPSPERLTPFDEELPRTPDRKKILLVLIPFSDVEVAHDRRRMLGEVTLERLSRL
jgi:hypothetical protein